MPEDPLPTPFSVLRLIVAIAGVSLVLASCSEQGTTGQRVASWVGATGLNADITQIKTDVANVAKVEKIGTPGAIRTNCAVLDLDTENANGNLPSPNQQLTADLTNVYTAEIQAAQDCFHGAGKSKTLLARSQIAQQAADADLTTALDFVAQLTGKS
jgi:hypothetical protein